MRRAVVLTAVLLCFACSAPNWSEAQKGESDLTVTYQAMNTDPYPLTVPVFVACDHFRIVGEETERDFGELLLYAKDPTDWAAQGAVQAWGEKLCKS